MVANFCVYFVIKLVRTTVRTAISSFSPLKICSPYILRPKTAQGNAVFQAIFCEEEAGVSIYGNDDEPKKRRKGAF